MTKCSSCGGSIALHSTDVALSIVPDRDSDWRFDVVQAYELHWECDGCEKSGDLNDVRDAFTFK